MRNFYTKKVLLQFACLYIMPVFANPCLAGHITYRSDSGLCLYEPHVINAEKITPSGLKRKAFTIAAIVAD